MTREQDGAPSAAKDASTWRVREKGVAFCLDLDKTYLATNFETVRGLVRIPFEHAEDKAHLPGVPEMVRALRRTAEESGLEPSVFFLSGSPKQLSGAIQEKLAADGVVVDAIVFKDQLQNIVRGRWRSLKEQVGYKLSALLESRRRDGAARHEILFGDDWESDPIIYSLYADTLSGVLPVDSLAEHLRTLAVASRSRRRILAAAEELSGVGTQVIERIFIRLEKRTPPAQFHAFGPRLVPTFNYLQTAAALYEAGRLDLPGVVSVARALRENPGLRAESLRNSLDDLVRRGYLTLGARSVILRRLEKEGLSSRARHERALRERLRASRERWRRRPGVPDLIIDYRAILAERPS